MRFSSLFVLLILAVACSRPTANSDNKSVAEAIAVADSSGSAENEIRSLMNNQIESWNSGDIEGYMSAYWNNERLTFIGSKGLTYGFDITLQNYKKAYPDQSAMGELEFTLMEMKPLGDEHFYTIGMWQLNREQDTLAGWFDLLWEKKEEGWRIISDHSS